MISWGGGNMLIKKIKSMRLIILIGIFLCLYGSGFLGGYIIFNNKANALIQENIKKEEELKSYYEKADMILLSDGNKTINDEKFSKNKISHKKEAMVVEEVFNHTKTKVAFLTFDDGPSRTVTPKILDILEDNNIKATFFIIGNMAKENPDLLKQINRKGHAIGNHTYTHEFSKVYSNIEAFEEEVDKTNKVFKEILGDSFNSRLFRFPGGSFEKSKNPYKELIKNKNMVYVDWNVLNGDAEGHNIEPGRLLNRVKETIEDQKSIVILMHDAPAKQTTVEALPLIIEYLKSEGYEFKILE